MPRILGFDSWLAHHLGFLPFFNFRANTRSANYATSTFIAGVVVSLMVIPIVTSLSRQVFSQAPQGEREAAYALGSTRWGMIRTVVLPFGRAGMIGACMLGLGRALGETIAVTLILPRHLPLQLPRARERRQLDRLHDRELLHPGRGRRDRPR